MKEFYSKKEFYSNVEYQSSNLPLSDRILEMDNCFLGEQSCDARIQWDG